ncbi:MAG: ATP-binding protein [Candidatus Promineifilaceae bacterium]|nr:ATP-binding protein [Candidatus Promineifilaceae bacterium]
MTIRFRLTLLYTFILTVVLLLYGTAVYLFAQETLTDEVDRNLVRIAQEWRQETGKGLRGNTAILRLPEEELDVFQSATTFFMIVGTDGRVLETSNNLEGYDVVLDPTGRQTDPHFGTVIHNGQPLRVLTEPLLIETEGARTLIGYLQVARLVNNQTALMRQLRLVLLSTGVAAVSLSLLLGALLTRYYLKPLDEIAAVALRITKADDLSRRLPDTGRRDEIGRLTMVLNQTLERLERLFHARQRFLADASHELRTPLTTIRGNVDLMRRIGEADPEILDVVQDELERMTRLVDDLLLLARADTGGLPLQRKPVELDTVFLEVYRQVRSIDLHVDLIIDEVDQVCVLGDLDRLKQLMINLVDNAIKYTPPGGTVRMSLSKSDGTAVVEVADTGVGIPQEDLPRIFDRFYRVDKARSRHQGGSGLGLSIAKWIVKAHGGDIRVESQVGVGTRFIVLLPVMSKQHHERDRANGRALPATASTQPGVSD